VNTIVFTQRRKVAKKSTATVIWGYTASVEHIALAYSRACARAAPAHRAKARPLGRAYSQH
jgi:hypothetical protein